MISFILKSTISFQMHFNTFFFTFGILCHFKYCLAILIKICTDQKVSRSTFEIKKKKQEFFVVC